MGKFYTTCLIRPHLDDVFTHTAFSNTGAGAGSELEQLSWHPNLFCPISNVSQITGHILDLVDVQLSLYGPNLKFALED